MNNTIINNIPREELSDNLLEELQTISIRFSSKNTEPLFLSKIHIQAYLNGLQQRTERNYVLETEIKKILTNCSQYIIIS